MDKKEIKLQLTKEGDFLGTKCDFYKDENNNVYMTREQIGEALEYSDARVAITKIHTRNKDRLDKFSVRLKITADDGKKYNTTLYNKKGILEIVKISTQPIMYKKQLLKSIGCDNNTIKLILSNNINKKYKQHQLHKILYTTYPHIQLDTEVVIDDYRVDFILNNSIIIECDEFGHVDRDEKYEEFREWYLNECLGYYVLRYNPDSKDELEVFRLLEQINNILYKDEKSFIHMKEECC